MQTTYIRVRVCMLCIPRRPIPTQSEAGSESGVRLGPMHSPILLDGTKLHRSIYKNRGGPGVRLGHMHSCAVTSSNCFHRLINGSKV